MLVQQIVRMGTPLPACGLTAEECTAKHGRCVKPFYYQDATLQCTLPYHHIGRHCCILPDTQKPQYFWVSEW